MLNEEIKKRLKTNWGEKADALDCYAEVRYIDRISTWSCYVYALDEDDDTIMCFIPEAFHQLVTWSLKDLYSCYDRDGEPMTIDEEYRRTRVTELIRRYG